METVHYPGPTVQSAPCGCGPLLRLLHAPGAGTHIKYFFVLAKDGPRSSVAGFVSPMAVDIRLTAVGASATPLFDDQLQSLAGWRSVGGRVSRWPAVFSLCPEDSPGLVVTALVTVVRIGPMAKLQWVTVMRPQLHDRCNRPRAKWHRYWARHVGFTQQPLSSADPIPRLDVPSLSRQTRPHAVCGWPVPCSIALLAVAGGASGTPCVSPAVWPRDGRPTLSRARGRWTVTSPCRLPTTPGPSPAPFSSGGTRHSTFIFHAGLHGQAISERARGALPGSFPFCG